MFLSEGGESVVKKRKLLQSIKGRARRGRGGEGRIARQGITCAGEGGGSPSLEKREKDFPYFRNGVRVPKRGVWPHHRMAEILGAKEKKGLPQGFPF